MFGERVSDEAARHGLDQLHKQVMRHEIDRLTERIHDRGGWTWEAANLVARTAIGHGCPEGGRDEY
jgi:hypothetical protein